MAGDELLNTNFELLKILKGEGLKTVAREFTSKNHIYIFD